MNILLSAFACAPNRGSEPGVAWNWIRVLSKQGHDLIVITQDRNRKAIEASTSELSPNVRFVFISLFGIQRIPGGTLGHYLYYHIWQLAALVAVLVGRHWIETDIVHHLTYGGVRTGSLLWVLPRRFIFGPVGGGESVPRALLRSLRPKARLLELTRNVSNVVARFDPVFLLMQWRASAIYVKTPQTADLILKQFRPKTYVELEIGSPSISSAPAENSRDPGFRILFAGRLNHWKGADLVLGAIEELERQQFPISAWFVGTGPDEAMLRRRASRLSIAKVVFTGMVPQQDLFALYCCSDVLAFPSMHDSSGNVALEALSLGLPVICLDLGGPPLIVGEAGVVLSTAGKTVEELSRDLAASLRSLAGDAERLGVLRGAALNRARLLTWERAARRVYDRLENPSFIDGTGAGQ